MGFGGHKCITEELGGAFLSLSPEPVASNPGKAVFLHFFQQVFLQFLQDTTDMKQERQRNTCLPKFEAVNESPSIFEGVFRHLSDKNHHHGDRSPSVEGDRVKTLPV